MSKKRVVKLGFLLHSKLPQTIFLINLLLLFIEIIYNIGRAMNLNARVVPNAIEEVTEEVVCMVKGETHRQLQCLAEERERVGILGRRFGALEESNQKGSSLYLSEHSVQSVTGNVGLVGEYGNLTPLMCAEFVSLTYGRGVCLGPDTRREFAWAPIVDVHLVTGPWNTTDHCVPEWTCGFEPDFV
ncbi:hypothetical protein L6452_18922 [Arctium lappa]|uniref:Uncharacterized protein n=1 Tax=Arctium lappa TaxID=4217 RepID=A0ACB9BBM6_ARCLA|nr:hypothetical protein L6452_18922 [Arctium lappa]